MPPVSEYLGCGEVASLISELDSLEAEKRALEWQQEKANRAEYEESDDEVKVFSNLVRDYTKAFLISQGFHTHKGIWRKQRQKQ